MVIFPAESNVLAGHPVKSSRYIPGLVRIARILREVGRSRSSRSAVDRRQQHQIASRIIDFSAAERQRVLVAIEPQAVVEHVNKEGLLWGPPRNIPAADPPPPVSPPISPQRGNLLFPKNFPGGGVF